MNFNFILKPKTFFEEISEEKIGLKTPLFVVLSISIFSILNFVIEVFYFNSPRYGEALIFPFLMKLLGPMLLWFLVTSVFSLLSYPLDYVGNFFRLLKFIGYSFYPIIVFQISKTIMILFDPPFLGFNYISPSSLIRASILFWLWSGDLWIYVLETTRDVELKKSLFSVFLILLMLFFLLNQEIFALIL
ncbi:hypothetical protein C9439_04455 [archaeon SCG-AAA382B04]|nr:hypothetical protein C9439_04455 [archaeon SCG-AAA382B04]